MTHENEFLLGEKRYRGREREKEKSKESSKTLNVVYLHR